MIKINFAQRKRSETTKATAGLSNVRLPVDLERFQELLPFLREFPFKRYLAVILLSWAASYALDQYKNTELKAIDDEIARTEGEKPKLQTETGQMKGLEELKRSMEADGQVITTKLDTIKKLMVDRGVILKVLLELSKVTPPDVWISKADYKGVDLSLSGYSLDFSKISDFMKQLNESSIFSESTLKDTQMSKDAAGREVATFTIYTRKR